MNEPPDFYLLLGVPQDASEAEIRAAFATAIKKWHPDTAHGENGDRARFLIEARDTLTDPARRQVYDAERQQGSLIRSAARIASQWIFVCSQGLGQFRTITEALEAAKDGDKIYVLPGVYRESIITVEKSVELAGQGSDDEDVVVESEDDILYFQADGATIRGLSFRTLAAQRIAVRANSNWGTISTCKFFAPQGTGLLIEGGSHLVVEGCSFENCKLGVRIEGARPAILASKFTANATGILVRAGCDCAIENNDFTDNERSSIEIQEDTSASVLRNHFKGGMIAVAIRANSRGSIDHNQFFGFASSHHRTFATDGTINLHIGSNNKLE
jgi:hypothetical protein